MPPTSSKIAPRARSRAVRLVLELGGTPYVIRPLACSDGADLRAFRLLKDDGTIYDVVERKTGLECDCPDFIFRRDGIDPDGCKHIQGLTTAGIIGVS